MALNVIPEEENNLTWVVYWLKIYGLSLIIKKHQKQNEKYSIKTEFFKNVNFINFNRPKKCSRLKGLKKKKITKYNMWS